MNDMLREYQDQLNDLYEMTKRMAWGSAITRDAIEIAKKLLNICIKQAELIDSLYEQIESERRLP